MPIEISDDVARSVSVAHVKLLLLSGHVIRAGARWLEAPRTWTLGPPEPGCWGPPNLNVGVPRTWTLGPPEPGRWGPLNLDVGAPRTWTLGPSEPERWGPPNLNVGAPRTWTLGPPIYSTLYLTHSISVNKNSPRLESNPEAASRQNRAMAWVLNW